MVYQFLLEDVMLTLHEFITTTSSTVAAIAGAVGSTALGLYVLFWGIALLSGQSNEPFIDGAKRIVRGVVILMFATSAGIYSEYVVDFFWTFPGALASEVVAGTGGVATNDVATTAAMLDSALGRGLKAGELAWNEMGSLDIMASFGYGLIAIVTWVVVALVTAAAAAMVLVSNIGLSIMLGLGPLFILMAIFQATQQLFVAWTRQVITYAVFFVIVAAIVSLIFSFYETFIGMLDLASFSSLIINFVKLLAISAAALFVLWRAESMAQGLGGGVGTSAGSAVGRFVSKATGGVAGTMARRDYKGQWKGAVPTGAKAAGRLGAAAVVGTAVGVGAYMRRNQIRRG